MGVRRSLLFWSLLLAPPLHPSLDFSSLLLASEGSFILWWDKWLAAAIGRELR